MPLGSVVANGHVIRSAGSSPCSGPSALAYPIFLLQRVHQERLAALNDRIASQELLLSEYRTKLKGATAGEAAAQIADLTKRLDGVQKNLDETRAKLALLDNPPHDPDRLYQGRNAIA